MGEPATDIDDQGWAATRTWVGKALPEGDHIVAVERLSGGWTSEMRRLRVAGTGEPRLLVLPSFAEPFFVRHAAGLLTREAAVLSPLRGTDVPAAAFHAVDATAADCDHPSLLMSLLPGSVRLGAEGAGERAMLLARQLVRIHRQRISAADRPRTYQAWTAPDRVRVPEGTDHPELWRRAVDVIRREPPEYRACLLHRDFHPGNVLFDGQGDALRITGVVDWVESSWGPVDWDVAHCATALALLHGARAGMLFADHYLAAGGRRAAEPAGHLYWRMLDALAFAPDAEKVAIPWRELGRADLSPALLGDRLEGYLRELLRRYG